MIQFSLFICHAKNSLGKQEKRFNKFFLKIITRNSNINQGKWKLLRWRGRREQYAAVRVGAGRVE